jgi:hypothetical protein
MSAGLQQASFVDLTGRFMGLLDFKLEKRSLISVRPIIDLKGRYRFGKNFTPGTFGYALKNDRQNLSKISTVFFTIICVCVWPTIQHSRPHSPN